jgi:hypothetical protein
MSALDTAIYYYDPVAKANVLLAIVQDTTQVSLFLCRKTLSFSNSLDSPQSLPYRAGWFCVLVWLLSFP